MLSAACSVGPQPLSSRVLEMIDMLTIERTLRTSWGTARRHASGAALWSTDHPYVALGLLYGVLAYLGSAVLIGVPGRALVALVVVGPAGWWCFGRYQVLMSAQTSRLSFFTGENGPLRLSEDLLSSKIVYCIGLRNDGKTALGSTRVTLDDVDGHPRPAIAASLPIFRGSDDKTDLQPGETEYFCVMRIAERADQDDGTAIICCHDNQEAPRFGLRELAEGRAITLSAWSEGAPRTTKRLQISAKREVGAVWSLDMALLPDTADASALDEQARVVPPPAPAADVPSMAVVEAEAEAEAEKIPIAHPPLQDAIVSPMPVAEQTPDAHPLAPDAVATPMPVVEQRPVATAPAPEPTAQSERIRRLLARQGRT